MMPDRVYLQLLNDETWRLAYRLYLRLMGSSGLYMTAWDKLSPASRLTFWETADAMLQPKTEAVSVDALDLAWPS